MAQRSRPCKGCGEPIYRTNKTAPIALYHGPDCRPRCSIADCEKPVHAKGWCAAHAERARTHGDPLAPKVRHRNEGPCEIDGCVEPMRKLRMCVGHYGMMRRHGEIRDWNFRWSEPDGACVVCASPVPEGSRRKYCSAACHQFAFRNPEGAPTQTACARCHALIDLLSGTSKGRRRIRLDVRLCKRCKSQSRTEATPGELALRDGPYCQLCGCDVDMDAVFPDPMRPSVDHIVPRALGGSDAAENNQLTHLRCNQIKSDRVQPLGLGAAPK